MNKWLIKQISSQMNGTVDCLREKDKGCKLTLLNRKRLTSSKLGDFGKAINRSSLLKRMKGK